MESAQKIISWKKVNINKVSESFDTWKKLCILALEEAERLTIYFFMVQNDKIVEEIVRLDQNGIKYSVGLRIARLYIEYINEMNINDNRRLYMFRFVIIATQFCDYWKATRPGDRVTMYHIQKKWIGVHSILGKNKCVEN